MDTADPFQPHWSYFTVSIGSMQRNILFNQLKAKSYHNLCKFLQPPPLPPSNGIGALLGLELKLCIQTYKPISISINKSIGRFTRDVRLKHACVRHINNEDKIFNKKLYIKSNWQLPLTPPKIENGINKLKGELNKIRSTIIMITKSLTNLASTQQDILHSIRSNKTFLILIANKNLSHAIMERGVYIQHMLDKHLCVGETYTLFTTLEVEKIPQDFKEELQKLLVITHVPPLED